jgi:DNA-binding LytR/AlgR family response regulator
MNCIIIEDQPPAQRILKKYIADCGSLNLIGIYGDALESTGIINAGSVDLLFLDIHLPKISGIDFLRALTQPPNVILTTAFADFALESYDLNVVDYLLKPFSFARFIQAIDKVNIRMYPTNLEKEESVPIFIKSGYDHIKVHVDEILCIKADGDYTEFNLGTKKILSSESLKHWFDYFGDQMVRIHKSYIINKDHIQKIRSSHVILGDNLTIPIGRAYKEDVQRLL